MITVSGWQLPDQTFAVLLFIRTFHAQNGRPPSYWETARARQITDDSAMAVTLHLIDAGLLRGVEAAAS